VVQSRAWFCACWFVTRRGPTWSLGPRLPLDASDSAPLPRPVLRPVSLLHKQGYKRVGTSLFPRDEPVGQLADRPRALPRLHPPKHLPTAAAATAQSVELTGRFGAAVMAVGPAGPLLLSPMHTWEGRVWDVHSLHAYDFIRGSGARQALRRRPACSSNRHAARARVSLRRACSTSGGPPTVVSCVSAGAAGGGCPPCRLPRRAPSPR
jgi:hypothetical protein